MRIVESFQNVNKCPNCSGHNDFSINFNEFGRMYLKCRFCNEELFEDEDTCYVVGKAPDDIDDSLMDIEYEVSNLPRYATNTDELEQLERIRDIFDELISVIRRMK
jgi:phage FluMu protein Com